MSYRYILGTKNKNWFVMFHTVDDLTFVTNNPSEAVGVNSSIDITAHWMEDIIKNTGKFIQYNGLESELPYDQIIGIKIEKEDLCIFETELIINLKQCELNGKY